mmetsp:Transcript_26039/g.72924  ORF Transcript_26039/g.72924 Transcript_26039/m.72924 type:complete len:289 (+) Transcript_26039:954-1820(+)
MGAEHLRIPPGLRGSLPRRRALRAEDHLPEHRCDVQEAQRRAEPQVAPGAPGGDAAPAAPLVLGAVPGAHGVVPGPSEIQPQRRRVVHGGPHLGPRGQARGEPAAGCCQRGRGTCRFRVLVRQRARPREARGGPLPAHPEHDRRLRDLRVRRGVPAGLRDHSRGLAQQQGDADERAGHVRQRPAGGVDLQVPAGGGRLAEAGQERLAEHRVAAVGGRGGGRRGAVAAPLACGPGGSPHRGGLQQRQPRHNVHLVDGVVLTARRRPVEPARLELPSAVEQPRWCEAPGI